MIKESANDFSVKMMCQLLCVSSSGYYDCRDRLPSKRAQQNASLLEEIKVIFDKERGRPGAKRIAKRLKLNSIQASQHVLQG